MFNVYIYIICMDGYVYILAYASHASIYIGHISRLTDVL